MLLCVLPGHKRLRLASTPGLRAMSGLGTSPGSAEGGSSGRTGLAAAADGPAGAGDIQQQEEMPVLQATSVAETIMDTMRSLEKVSLEVSCVEVHASTLNPPRQTLLLSCIFLAGVWYRVAQHSFVVSNNSSRRLQRPSLLHPWTGWMVAL